MIKLLFPVLVGGGLMWDLFRNFRDKPSRWTGAIIAILSAACFMLYYLGFTGIGLSELLLALWGKVESML